MSEPKPKKVVAKRLLKAKAPVAAAANSPAPTPCPKCGELGCGGDCRGPISVRYAGPTSHLSHHHMHMAAEGGKHVWAAAVVAGLAVVITVSVAYSAVQAASETRTTIRQTVSDVQVLQQIGQMREQLNRIEQKVNAVVPEEIPSIVPEIPSTQATSGDQVLQNAP